MKTLPAILLGLAVALTTAPMAAVDADPSATSGDPTDQTSSERSGYTYIRDVVGDVAVISAYNGRVDAKRNLPVSTGDEMDVSDAGRAEVALADGNVLFVGGGTRVRFESLRDQQGEDGDVSAIQVTDGSVVLLAAGSDAEQIPRLDTEDLTVYVNSGGRVRVNADPHRGSVVIGRAGTAEVRTPAGSFRLRNGEFLEAHGEEEPQIERGAFSRDRFDIWVADAMETTTTTRSASSQYVDERYAGDSAALDGNGDWQYNDEYNTEVWSPSVEPGWTPYSDGSWYYTPAGLTWWSNEPWGWVPFHYGTWFFSSPWNRWCWRPASVYSPAWVYWAYTPSYVGWCPLGSYAYWSPWFDNYYRHLGWFNRGNVSLAINGMFSARAIDFRGWNFVGTNRLGTEIARMDVIPGARIGPRLGTAQVAVSSRPFVVNARPGQVREAVQGFVREAPRVVERTTSPSDSARLAPLLSRQRTLSASTLEAVQQRAAVAQAGRLTGPGAADVAPRGALVDRSRTSNDAGRERPMGAPPSPASPAAPLATESRAVTRASTDDWRSRPSSGPDRAADGNRTTAQSAPASESRGRTDVQSPATESWRTRAPMPPARRVIDGAVPGRRGTDHVRRQREDASASAPSAAGRPAPVQPPARAGVRRAPSPPREHQHRDH